MKNFRKVCRGERGFTLIELLVVIIILGVLAAVVTLAVTRFIGKGVLESANAELVTLQTAVEACLAEAQATEFTVDPPAWDGQVRDSGPYVDDPAGAPIEFAVYDQLRQHKLKASYNIDQDGDVAGATCAAAGQWGGTKIMWSTAEGKWVKYVAP